MSTTTAACPSCSPTACNYRSVWSLLAGCGLTMLICVWNAIHPSLPLPHYKRTHVTLYRLFLVLVAFFIPEVMITTAFDEWRAAKKMKKLVRERGHEWWTMTHSHFMLIGGFALRDHVGTREIEINELLSLVEAGEIVNSEVTERELQDKSTSDAIGKAILVVQLSWFVIQVIVRLMHHLTVTLIELDTVCLTLVTFPLVLFWWEKPRCPRCPHIFYTRGFVNREAVSQGEGVTDDPLGRSTIKTRRRRWDLVVPASSDSFFGPIVALLLTWTFFGASHALAWHHGFPTHIEKTLWRVSSLTLTGTPILFGLMVLASRRVEAKSTTYCVLQTSTYLPALASLASRLLLIVLMLASLRSLPPSAHQVIAWTEYIPHL